MKRRITLTVLLVTSLTVATGLAQSPTQLAETKQPVRLQIPPQSQVKFRVIDPIAQQVQATTKAVEERGERQLAVPAVQEWNNPTHPASLPRPQLPPTVITTTPDRRPAVFQADSRLRKQRKLVPQIRLVQAEDVDDSFLDDLRTSPGESGSAPLNPSDDIDELLKQAQDLIAEEREKASENRMSPDEIRARMQDELDRLLPDEEGGDDLDDDLLAESDDEEDEEDFSDLVDPEPTPVRRQQRQLPYTMGDIFDDEDDKDLVCERMFCERMWACAGGKCMSSMDRMKRNFRRNYALFYSPCGTPVCRPMENFQCPPRNRQPQNQQQNLQHNPQFAQPIQATPMMEHPPLADPSYPVEMLPIESPAEFSATDLPEPGPVQLPLEGSVDSVHSAIDAAAGGGPADSIFGPAQ